MMAKSISTRLLKRVLSIYLLVTALIFVVQVAIEYAVEREDIDDAFAMVERTFDEGIAYGLWHFDRDQVALVANGMAELPYISRVEIVDAAGKSVFDVQSPHHGDEGSFLDRSFSHVFEVGRQADAGWVTLGQVRISSNNRAIVERLMPGMITTLVGVALKAALLIGLVIISFNAVLTRPLGRLAEFAGSIDPENIPVDRPRISTTPGDEIGVLENALGGLIDKVERSMADMDTLNRELEHKVVERTASLAKAVEALEHERGALAAEVGTRKAKERALEEANARLERSLDSLRKAQTQLVETEKMAALGGLVAGVAHEINTPVGLGITGITHFQHLIEDLERRFRAGELEEAQFTQFLADAVELVRSIHVSLTRTAELVRSFKLVAVDQSHESVRIFDLRAYANEVLVTHTSLLKKIPVHVQVDGPEVLAIHSDPGVWSQVLSNLIVNAVRYAFSPGTPGRIVITLREPDPEHVVLEFADDGKGMTEAVMNRIFEPFFTTGRDKGGSGLGMHIVFNLITQRLKGSISVASAPGEGARFVITAPRRATAEPSTLAGE